jgi:hypothetical protein
MPYHFRRARRYVCATPYVPRRRKTTPVPVDIVHARVTDDGLVEFRVAWGHGVETWEPEARMASEHKALIETYEQQRVARGRPTDAVGEGVRNAAARRAAHTEWVTAHWASAVYMAKTDLDRAEILAKFTTLKDPSRVHIRTCVVKVESFE